MLTANGTLTAHDIEILTIASCSAPHGASIATYVPPPGELARVARSGLLRLATVQRATIDPATGRARPYVDLAYELTAAGDAVLERAMRGEGLSEEARRMLEA